MIQFARFLLVAFLITMGHTVSFAATIESSYQFGVTYSHHGDQFLDRLEGTFYIDAFDASLGTLDSISMTFNQNVDLIFADAAAPKSYFAEFGIASPGVDGGGSNQNIFPTTPPNYLVGGTMGYTTMQQFEFESGPVISNQIKTLDLSYTMTLMRDPQYFWQWSYTINTPQHSYSLNVPEWQFGNVDEAVSTTPGAQVPFYYSTYFYSPLELVTGWDMWHYAEGYIDLNVTYNYSTLPPSTVPEPSAFTLLGAGLGGLIFWKRKRKV